MNETVYGFQDKRIRSPKLSKEELDERVWSVVTPSLVKNIYNHYANSTSMGEPGEDTCVVGDLLGWEEPPLLHTAAGDSDITTRRRTAVWVVLTSKVMAFRERKQSRIYKKSKKTKKAARTTGLLQIINRLRQRPFDASSPFDTTRGEYNFRTNDRSRASPLVIDTTSKRQN